MQGCQVQAGSRAVVPSVVRVLSLMGFQVLSLMRIRRESSG